jgi:hypothetical protein
LASSEKVSRVHAWVWLLIGLVVGTASIALVLLLSGPAQMSQEEAKKRLLIKTDFLSKIEQVETFQIVVDEVSPLFGIPPVEAGKSNLDFMRSPILCSEDNKISNMLLESKELAAVDFQSPNPDKLFFLYPEHLSQDIVRFADEETAIKFIETSKEGYLNQNCGGAIDSSDGTYNIKVQVTISAEDLPSKFGVKSQDSAYFEISRSYFPANPDLPGASWLGFDRVTSTTLVRSGSAIMIVQDTAENGGLSEMASKAIKKFTAK